MWSEGGASQVIKPSLLPRWAASVTDNFDNRDNLRAGEPRSKRKSGSSHILSGRRGTQAATITSVTEVIEVIGYQLWGGCAKGRVLRDCGPSSCPYSPKCVEGEFCEVRLTLEAVGSRHPRRWNAAGAPPGSSTLLPPLRRFAGIVLPTRRSARRMSPAPLTPALETNASTMSTGRGA